MNKKKTVNKKPQIDFQPICVIMGWVIEMDEKNLPKRKDLRLKQYDYSSAGAYFVTICIKDGKIMLSDIIKPVGVGASSS